MVSTIKTRSRRKVEQPLRESSSITLYYDETDTIALKTLDLFLSLGIFSQKQTAIDEGIADIKAGRITKIDNPKNLIAECLKKRVVKLRHCYDLKPTTRVVPLSTNTHYLLQTGLKKMSKEIKATGGKPPNDLIEDHVILEAKVLLKSTDMSLKNISDVLCFCTPSHFGRFFKRYTGYTPIEYKKI